MTDPNQGTKQFTYNDFGALLKEVDANNASIFHELDTLGRVVKRTSAQEEAVFAWDTKKKVCFLAKVLVVT